MTPATSARPAGRPGPAGSTAPREPGAAPAPRPQRLLDPGLRRLTCGVTAMVLLAAFEAMAVATALPVAARALDGVALYGWAFSGFLVTSLLGMVLAGGWADRRGPGPATLTGSACFVTGLVVSGTAGSMPVLAVGRAVQGVGSGLIGVALYVVVAQAFDDAVRPRVFSLMAAAWVLPSMIGPAVAGWLSDAASWRWVFLGVPPLVVPALVLLWPVLRPGTRPAEPPPAAGATGGPARPSRGSRRLVAAAAVCAGAALLQFAGNRLALLSLLLAVAGVPLVLLGLVPLLPAGALRLRRGVASAVVLRGVLNAAFFGTESYIPLLLVEQRGLSATAAGLSLAGSALGWTAGSWWQGRLPVGAARARAVRLGTVVVAVGVAGVLASLLVDPSRPLLAALAVVAAWTVAGAGMGLSYTGVSVLVLERSEAGNQGGNSSALSVCDALGSVVGIGIGGSVLAAGVRSSAAGTPPLAAFAGIAGAMLAVALLGTALAPRLRPVS